MLQADVVGKIMEILRSSCDDPAEEMIRTGECLIEIGKALKPLSPQEARRTILAVQALV